MATLVQKFLIRARRNGLSAPKLLLGCVALVTGSALISGLDGVLFSLAVGTAFLLGTATRDGTFHLHSLATTPTSQPIDRDTLLARLEADTDLPDVAGQALCLAVLLDGYDELRDRHGQRALKSITAQMAERLYGEIRHSDSLADLGDGRFAVYLPPNPRIDLESAIQTALRLQAVTMRPVTIDGLRLHLTSSLGFCVSSRLGEGPGAPGLLDAAETALQTALRDAPRAIRAFDHTMLRGPAARKVAVDTLDAVAAFEQGRILPWYQPQICADTGALTGIEALARWHHPEIGVLKPAQFLRDLQEQGLSSRLTDSMVEAAIGQLVAWDRTGIHIPRVSVNLGIDDLADPALVNRIKWALDRHSMPPARLGLEVLETVIAQADPDAMATRNLLALGALGCPIDLDDFGTGSASINGIRRFGVSRIKIDRSLVTSVDTDPDQHGMIAAILTLAQQLGVEVVAEGVETPGEFSTLAQLGCGHVQGFAIARPMPAPDLLAWLLRRGAGRAPDFPEGSLCDTPETLRRDVTRGRMGGKTA